MKKLAIVLLLLASYGIATAGSIGTPISSYATTPYCLSATPTAYAGTFVVTAVTGISATLPYNLTAYGSDLTTAAGTYNTYVAVVSSTGVGCFVKQ